MDLAFDCRVCACLVVQEGKALFMIGGAGQMCGLLLTKVTSHLLTARLNWRQHGISNIEVSSVEIFLH